MPTEKRNFLRMNSDFSPLRLPVGEVRRMLNCCVEPTHINNTPGTTVVQTVLYNSTQEYTATCGPGLNGTPVTRSATVTTYSSQAEANTKAYNLAKKYAEEALVCTPDITFQPFDYMVLRYSWAASGGSDLDTFTGFINTGTQHDNDWVGYGQGDNRVPVGAANPYMWWGSDNTANGVESILVNMKLLEQDYPNLPEIVQVRLNAVWWGTKGTGDVSVQMSTYLGGTMRYDSPTFNFVNEGGVVVDNQTIPRNVQVSNHLKDINQSTPVAVLNWNKTTKSATLTLP